ncbi:MAG: DNA primase [Olsenella sp.]|nr:DNA primase [Olsenella sp.]MCI1289383.1 DNA primase [Olsenella sp.]
MITDEDKERVRQATDMLQLVGETVELKRRGSDWWGCCPFHHEKSPSFHVNPTTGLWKCFGCGAGGDVFAYVMKRESLDFPDSIRYLAERAGIELSEERSGPRRGPRRTRVLDCLQEAEKYYNTQLMRGRGDGPAAGRRYLSGRGFGSDVCRRWGLGFAPGHGALTEHLRAQGFSRQELVSADLALEGQGGRLRDRFYDRVMFPIHDEQGRTIAFGGRVMTDAKPKYLNTKETAVFSKGKHLFAFDRAKDSMVATGTCIVCEGYTDVIAMHEAGFTNAVATLGTALTMDHVKLIERFARRRIVCMFDGDEAGQRAAERAVRYIDKTGVEMLCVVLPNNQDPMEFLRDHGADALRPILEAAQPLMDFVFGKRLAGYDLSVPGRRVAALDDMAQVLAPLADSMLMDGYATQLADMLGFDVDRVRQVIRDKAAAARRKEAERSRMEAQQPQPQSQSQWQGDRQAAAPQQAAQGGGGEGRALPAAALSTDERMQSVAERELLSMIATHPDVMRQHGDRIATFTWSDSRFEAMAWAMLATPAGTPPAEVVGAATDVVADAPRILAGGRLEVTSRMPVEQRADFLLDVVELWSKRREVREIKARLRMSSSSVPDDQARGLFRTATELQKRINELSNRVSAVA